jgi:hypothetical protein
MNEELGKYAAVTTAQVAAVSNELFRPENQNTLYYYANPSA